MAFLIADLRSIHSIGAMPVMAQATIRERRHAQLWHYVTTDDLNNVLGFDYMSLAGSLSDGTVSAIRKGLLRVGDIIMVSTSVDLAARPDDALDLNINTTFLTVVQSRSTVRLSMMTSPGNYAWNTTQPGTPASLVKTTLASHTLTGGFIVNVGQGIRLRALLKTAANANLKTITLELSTGTPVYLSMPAVASNNEAIEIQGDFIYATATTGHFHGRLHRGATVGTWLYAATTFTWSANNTFSITATNGTAAANDVVLHSFQVSQFGG
jgi:hypothetical protein